MAPGQSADLSGAIKVGDDLLEVDGIPCIGLTLDEIKAKVAGKRGTKVTMRMMRDASDDGVQNGEIFSVCLKRGAWGPEHCVLEPEVCFSPANPSCVCAFCVACALCVLGLCRENSELSAYPLFRALLAASIRIHLPQPYLTHPRLLLPLLLFLPGFVSPVSHSPFLSTAVPPRPRFCPPLSRDTQDKDMIDQGRWPAPGAVSSNTFDATAINRR